MQFLPLNRDLIIHEGIKVFEQKKSDEQWVKNWTEKKKNRMYSLATYRQKLIEHAQLLRQYEQALNESNHEQLKQFKIQIEQSNSLIYDENHVKNVGKQIYRRKLKRARLRRQKTIRQLSPVTTTITNNDKIADIKTLLNIISQLKSSHQSNELLELERLCSNKFYEYQADLPLINHLFNNQNQSFYESNNVDAQYYLRAHQNINDLIEVRRGWDQFAINSVNGSHLPTHWYQAQTPADHNWSKYISH